MLERKREQARLRKQKQRAQRTEEQLQAETEYKSEWRRSEAGKESNWKALRKWRLKQKAVTYELADAKEEVAIAKRQQEAAEWRVRRAEEQNDVIKMGYFEAQTKGIQGPGNRIIAA